ncbi:MAG: hypothetical protein FWE13_02795 [Firmicutes bacterium]|nr:hypothetical protein [Bacillota bacterium]
MIKKFITIIIAFIMLFALVGLSACEVIFPSSETTTSEQDTTSSSDRVGVHFSLQHAYDSEYITREDIKHIAYFVTGGRVIEVLDSTKDTWVGEKSWPEEYWTRIRRIDFNTQKVLPTVADINPNTASDIKLAFYNDFRERLGIDIIHVYLNLKWHISNGRLPYGTTILDTIIIRDFFGEYNGVYAVRMSTLFGGYPDELVNQIISNVGWTFGTVPVITAFKYQ